MVVFHSLYSYIYDEYQDFAPTEIECISCIFLNSIFNLFGTLKQCINPKGIQYAQEIPLKVQQFTLQENYRNALEITQYTNETFNMDMLPIGIHGRIRKLANMPIVTITPGGKDRIALIYKKRGYPLPGKNYAKNTKYHFLNETNIEIVTEQINVLPIALAKGLEFERVYVMADGMTENEKYVATTHALGRFSK